MELHRHAVKQINAALLQPSKWLTFYEELVTKNVNTVGQIESALRSLTYIIPGVHLFPVLPWL
jgi:peroxin-16